MAKINVDIKVVALFDEGKERLASNGYRIISLQENARLRMQESAGSYVSQNGNCVREGAIYVPGKGYTCLSL